MIPSPDGKTVATVVIGFLALLGIATLTVVVHEAYQPDQATLVWDSEIIDGKAVIKLVLMARTEEALEAKIAELSNWQVQSRYQANGTAKPFRADLFRTPTLTRKE